RSASLRPKVKPVAAGRKPKSECLHNGSRRIDAGTLCRQESPSPGSLGFSSAGSSGTLSTWRGTLDGWMSSAGQWMEHASDVAVGHGKSAVLSIVDLVPFKQQSPIATALFKHYVERSGATYEIQDIPIEWQDWIVRATKGKPGLHKNLNPYNSGLY